jgi:protein required for attachment to host cells
MSGAADLWVVAFDGALARVWECDEDGRLHERQGDGLDARANSEAARRDGRGEGQPDLPHPGYVQQWSEPKFVEHLASRLAMRAGQGGFRRLVIAADPQALGYFRQCAPEELKRMVTAEVARDYVLTPVKDMEAALAEHLPRPRRGAGPASRPGAAPA